MHCQNCSTENPEGAKVCIQCAALLRRACPKCGFENPPEAHFCAQCTIALTEGVAVPLAKAYLAREAAVERAHGTTSPGDVAGPALQAAADSAAPADGERKTAAALFVAIKGLTELEQDLDSEEARAIIDPALKLMIDAGRRYEAAALLAHRHEEAGETGAAARWHGRAAQWAGVSDIKAALHHWQRVRELARQGGDEPESGALTLVACSQALAHGWRLGASATEWAELFEEGCAAAQGGENLAALAVLNANYSAVRGLNQAITPDYVRYAGEAVRIADRTGDWALRCGTRGHLCFAHAWGGQLRESERVADEVIDLAREDTHLGTNVAGFSPLLAVRFIRHRCIGYTRDPATALRELPPLRQAALVNGYPEQALWALSLEAEFNYALGSSSGTRVLAQAAVRLAENLGVGNEILAALALCDALACDREWKSLLGVAGGTLRLIREQGALRLIEPSFLAHIGTAQIELGNLEEGRAAAEEGIVFMRESTSSWSPRSYAVLARAQLELGTPAADIARTLDEYAALLERTEFRLFEGELHELEARLAHREGRHVEKAAALLRAYDCHTSFGMRQQATRVA